MYYTRVAVSAYLVPCVLEHVLTEIKLCTPICGFGEGTIKRALILAKKLGLSISFWAHFIQHMSKVERSNWLEWLGALQVTF